jgi:Na+-translocating ferredoxin:NAD+ oxidoreductase RnfD subunit
MEKKVLYASLQSSAVAGLDAGVLSERCGRGFTASAAARAAKQSLTGHSNAAAAGVAVSPADVAALHSWGLEGLRVCWKGFGRAVESEYLVSKAVRYRTQELLMMVFQVIMGLVFAVKYFRLMPWQQHYFGLVMGEC